MKKPLLIFSLTFILLLFVYPTQAQSTFSRVFNGSGIDLKAYSIEKTTDRNYLIAGQKGNSALIIKTDTTANIIWCKTYNMGSGLYSSFNKIIATKDSSYVLLGKIKNAVNNFENTLVVKINSNGDTLWSKQLDLDDAESMISVEQTYDGGYILTGHINPFTANWMYKIAVVKLSADGNLSWAKKIECGNNNEVANAVIQLPDSSFVVTGYTENFPPFEGGCCLIKLSASGNVSWVKKHIGASAASSNGFNLKVYNNALFCYMNISGTPVLMKTDFSANVLWSKSYSASGYPGGNMINNDFNSKFCQTYDNNFVLLSFAAQWSNSLLYKVDTSGNLLMTKALILPVTDIIETYDKKLLCIGNGPMYGVKYSNVTDPEIGIIKTDSVDISNICTYSLSKSSDNVTISLTPVTFTATNIGSVNPFYPVITNTTLITENRCVLYISGIEEKTLPSENSITVFPNPGNGIFQFTFKNAINDANIEIFNAMGKKIYQLTDSDIKTSTIDLSNQPNGIYYMKLLSADKVCSQKIIIAH
jgi:hypothetical protein